MTDRWHYIRTLWTQHEWLYGAAGFILGLLAFPALQRLRTDALALLSDFVPEMFGIAFTVLFIDALYRRQRDKELKEQLIFQMGNGEQVTSRAAARKLRHKGWLIDGSLRGAKLAGTSLAGAILEQTNLAGTSLDRTNLSETILAQANLEGATLPDGTKWTPGRDMREFTHPDEWQAEQTQ